MLQRLSAADTRRLSRLGGGCDRTCFDAVRQQGTMQTPSSGHGTVLCPDEKCLRSGRRCGRPTACVETRFYRFSVPVRPPAPTTRSRGKRVGATGTKPMGCVISAVCRMAKKQCDVFAYRRSDPDATLEDTGLASAGHRCFPRFASREERALTKLAPWRHVLRRRSRPTTSASLPERLGPELKTASVTTALTAMPKLWDAPKPPDHDDQGP